MGAISRAATSTSVSNTAPGSDGSPRQKASAASHSAPHGANGLPARYSNTVSSGAIIPARPPRLDRHVAHGHATFHRERPDRAAPVLDRATGRAGRPDARDDGQDEVLRRAPEGQRAVDLDPQVAGAAALPQGLGNQHVARLGGADTEGERAECAVGGGVRVRADHEEPRLGEPQLGRDHVENPLVRVVDPEVPDAVPPGVSRKPLDHSPDRGVRNAGGAEAAPGSGNVVIGEGEDLAGPRHLAPVDRHLVERMPRTLVDEAPVDVEQGVPVPSDGDRVTIPDLVEQGTRLGHAWNPAGRWSERERRRRRYEPRPERAWSPRKPRQRGVRSKCPEGANSITTPPGAMNFTGTTPGLLMISQPRAVIRSVQASTSSTETPK